MTNAPHSTPTVTTFAGTGGLAITRYAWLPTGHAKAAVVIAHGLSEHALRYGAFAAALNAAGYAAYASDHRGHGATAGGVAKLGDSGPDGWNATLDDIARVVAFARGEHPGKPVFLFGHSMGSVLAQRFIQQHGTDVAGAVLSGSFGSIDHLDAVLQVADEAAAGAAAAHPSDLQPAMFAGFNAAFDAKTGFEWLSRDDVEVRTYVDDPFCGFPLTNGSLAAMLHGFDDAWKPEHEARVPATLPLLFIAGDADPAGAATGNLQALVERYRANGSEDLTLTLYPNARHELLNECEPERSAAVREIVAWLDEHATA
jgi:alpha-beta hydrolase superfamily lysophospholipase